MREHLFKAGQQVMVKTEKEMDKTGRIWRLQFNSMQRKIFIVEKSYVGSSGDIVIRVKGDTEAYFQERFKPVGSENEEIE